MTESFPKIKKGQIVPLNYEGRDFEAIVIDPNGLGKNQPSIGFGFMMMERYGGLPSSTSDNWLQGLPNDEDESLKTPSGKLYKVSRIKDIQYKNEYVVLEVSNWVELAADVIKKRGKVTESTKNKLVDFLMWFAIKGFYADAYTVLKGGYSPADSRAVSAWMQARLLGISKRNSYTKFLQEQGCEEWFEYANWTDYVYQGLFGMKAKQMREIWELVEGNSDIGRNYIPEAQGLEAVAYCERQVIDLFYNDLKQAHDDAIGFAKKRFNLIFDNK